MNSHFASRTPKLCVVNLSNSLAIACNSRLDFEYSEPQLASSRLIQSFPKEALINSTNGNHEPIITNISVDHLSNSGAITIDSRLGLDDSESHELAFGVNQHLPEVTLREIRAIKGLA